MVIAPANTGKDRSNKIAVKKTDQTNKGVWSHESPGVRIFTIVVIKFTAPKIEDAPARWSLKIERSTDPPAWAIFEAKGG